MKNNTSPDRQEIATDQERRSLFLRYTNRGWLIFGMVALLTIPFRPEERSVFAYSVAVVFPTYLIVRFLNRSGRTRLAGVVFTLAVNFGLYGLFLVLVRDLGAAEAFRTQATVWLLMGLAVLFAGALVDKWAAPVVALFNSLLLIGTRLTLAPESDPRPSAFVFWWMMAVIIWLYERTLQQALARAWNELAERQRANEQLLLSEARYRAVVEHQTEFIVRWKPDGARTFANEAYRRYFGLTSEQTVSAGFVPLVAEEDRDAVQAKVSRLISGDVLSEMDIHRVIKADGSIAWHEWVDQAICDETGKIVEFQSVGRDITERKRAQEALRESEALYRRAIEAAGAVPYYQGYTADSLNFVGEGIRQVTGYSAEEMTMDLWDSLVEEAQPRGDAAGYSFEEAIRRSRAGEFSNWRCDYRIRTRDGGIRWVASTAVEIFDTPGVSRGAIGILQDITERRRAEERMRELARRLVAAQEEERKRIAQELHDELGQALTAISLDLGSIEKALPQETSLTIRERLVDARSMADEVDERISEMALDLRPSLLDDLGLRPTLQWYLKRYSQRLGIEVAMDFEGLESRLPDEVETTLYRVIQEALTNIARHAQASSVRLTLEHSAGAISASIQDDGRGFDAHETQGSAASPGGLGLLGIKDRVSTLGGRVDIHSGSGQGTRIQIELPL